MGADWASKCVFIRSVAEGGGGGVRRIIIWQVGFNAQQGRAVSGRRSVRAKLREVRRLVEARFFLPRALPAVRGMSGCVDSRSGANSLKAASYFAGSCVQTLNWESFDQVDPAEQ